MKKEEFIQFVAKNIKYHLPSEFKDFKIEVHNDLMTISSEKQEENETKNEKEHYTKREFSYQAFTRSFTLHETADGDNFSANYDKGILTVSIPKKEEAKPKAPRTIEIQ